MPQGPLAEHKPSVWPQIFAAVVVNLNAFALGSSMGWSAMALPQLLSPDSELLETPLTLDEGSWVATLLPLAVVFFSPVGSTISTFIGRKTFGYAIALPLLASWILILTSTTVTTLYIGRVLSGMHGACALLLPPNYIGETISDEVRGAMASLVALSTNTGCLFAYVIGACLPYHVAIYINLALAAISAISFIFLPETPYKLLSFKRPHQARKALRWLRPGITDQQLESELSSIQASLDRGASKAAAGEPSPAEHLRSRAALAGMALVLLLCVNQQFCGSFVIVNYAVFIFQEAGGSVSPELATIILGTLTVFGGLFATPLMDRLGRRALLFTSNAFVGLSVAVLGAYFYLKTETQVDLSYVGWLPVTCLSAYQLMMAFGLSPLPYVIMSEVVTSRIRAFAATVGVIVISGTASVTLKVYPVMTDAMGTHGACWFFAGVCALCFLIEWFTLPETKGRPQEDIFKELNGGKDVHDSAL